ncbi:protein phosphatase 2C domain-containing protein [Lentzea sp. E54]|uniref:protein phosphatase 2C domain-containing protein n=1 Tax=Lentzea xerophila TaxID=3435883 RepID=UPI003DA44B55
MEKVKRAITGRRSHAWQVAHLSVQGDKHVRDGSPCQDDSDSKVVEKGTWAYVVVADGHGSVRHFRSDRGAQLAVATMRDVFHSFRRRARALGEPGLDELAQLWTQETDHVVSRWRAKVHADLVRHPAQVPGRTDGERGLVKYLDDFAKRNGYAQLELLFWQLRRFEQYAQEVISQEAEELGPLPHVTDAAWDQAKFGGWQAKAYGSTVLGVLIGPQSLHWVQLGDGAMVQIVGGEASYLVPPPPEAIGNLTPSLCDDNAHDEIRRGTEQIRQGHIPSAILLTTDGLPNSYPSDDRFFDFCEGFAQRAEASRDFGPVLPTWLEKISREGSGDDVSVALAWLTELPTPEKQTARPETSPAGPEQAGDGIEAVMEAAAEPPRPEASGKHTVRPAEPANPLAAEPPAPSTEKPEAKGDGSGAENR